jgi:hypothetical protein
MFRSTDARMVNLAMAFTFALCALGGVVRAADVTIDHGDGASVSIRSKPPSIHIEAKPDGVYDGSARSGGSDEPARPRPPHRASITIGDDGEYASFSQLVESDPWLAALIFMAVGLFFLVPIVLVIGIIWYKLRKTRLQNESMLALAERGLAPPLPPDVPPTPPLPVAPAAAATGSAAGAPGYEQLVAARKRAGMSDLRKGVLLIAFGLGFTMYSLLEDQAANWLGLTLLFVGGAYVVLWWAEERNLERRNSTGAGAN